VADPARLLCCKHVGDERHIADVALVDAAAVGAVLGNQRSHVGALHAHIVVCIELLMAE
jgi:hypothetical protein